MSEIAAGAGQSATLSEQTVRLWHIRDFWSRLKSRNVKNLSNTGEPDQTGWMLLSFVQIMD